MTPGVYTEHNIADHKMNDRIASFTCHKNVLAKFCGDWSWDECRYDHGEATAGTIFQNLMGYYDRTTSIKMWPYDVTTRPALMLFDGANCDRRSGVFFANEDGTKKSYGKNDLWINNTPKNSVASAMIPYGLSINIYEHDGFRG